MNRTSFLWLIVMLFGFNTLSIAQVASAFSKIYGTNTSFEDFTHVSKALDNDLLVVGGLEDAAGSDLILAKIDPSTGSSNLWLRAGSDSIDSPFGVAQLADGGFVVAANTLSTYDFYHGDMYIVKVTAFGTLAWSKKFGKPNDVDEGFAMSVAADGNLIVAGYSYAYSAKQEAVVWKIDASTGGVLWAKRLVFRNRPIQYFRAIENTTDGNILVLGTSFYANTFYDPILIKLNSTTGNIVWDKKYASTGSQLIYALKKTPDGYVFSGNTPNPTNANKADMFVTKVDETGTPLWSKRYNASLYERPTSLSVATNGDIMVGGYAEIATRNSLDTTQMALYMRLNSTGTIQTSQVFGDTLKHTSRFQSVIANSPTNTILLGYTFAFGNFNDGKASLVSINSSSTTPQLTCMRNIPFSTFALAIDSTVASGYVQNNIADNATVVGVFSLLSLNETTVCLNTSTQTDVPKNQTLIVYPNPANSFINLHARDIEKVEIFDVLGKSVLQISKPIDSNIDVLGLGKGIYGIKITHQSGNISTTKFIKE